jgi:ketol-acid reductoisomerase
MGEEQRAIASRHVVVIGYPLQGEAPVLLLARKEVSISLSAIARELRLA